MNNIFVQKFANVNDSLPKVMRLNNQSQTSLAEDTHYSQSGVSKIVHGKAVLTAEAFPSYLQALPIRNEAFALDAVHQMTGVTVPILNGQRIKQEVTAIVNRGKQELFEAIEALKSADDEFESPSEYVRDKTDPRNALNEVIDAELFIKAIELSICDEYGYELRDIMNEREKTWAARGLIK